MRAKELREAQEALPEDQRDASQVNNLTAQLAETAAVVPTIIVRVENYLNDLEGVMATIEEAQASAQSETPGAFKEAAEWVAAAAAVEQARQF